MQGNGNKWATLARQVGTAIVAIGALATGVNGWLEARAARGDAKDVGSLAADLASDPEAQHVYEALRSQIEALRAQVEFLSRRVESATVRIDALSDRVPPVTVAGMSDEEEADVLPEGLDLPPPPPPPRLAAGKSPRKSEEIPEVKAARKRRAGLLEQVQRQVLEQSAQ